MSTLGLSESMRLLALQRLLPAASERRSLRVACGLPMRAVANDIGVSVATLCRYELGRVAVGNKHVESYLLALRRMHDYIEAREEVELEIGVAQ